VAISGSGRREKTGDEGTATPSDRPTLPSEAVTDSRPPAAAAGTGGEHPRGSHDRSHQHRDLTSGGARATVFGVSDGLVTNVSLILGVAAAQPGASVVRLTGLAGLVAGAFSMASGEYVSMQAQRELMERELEVERRALRRNPEIERQELVAIYERRGIDGAVARDLVDQVMSDPDLALETHAREELGVDPSAFGSPWQAAAASFFSFALGAFLPLIPWLVGGGTAAVVASIVIGACAALAVGALLGQFTGRSRLRSAVRQLVVVTLAAGITFGIGRLIGANIH
jgi:VIT1/CCC1 family predicted Fe2+/Mn2+ transporter